MDKLKEPISHQRTDDFIFGLMVQVVKNFNELFERLESATSRLEDAAEQLEKVPKSDKTP